MRKQAIAFMCRLSHLIGTSGATRHGSCLNHAKVSQALSISTLCLPIYTAGASVDGDQVPISCPKHTMGNLPPVEHKLKLGLTPP